MQTAIKEVSVGDEDNIKDITASFDGTCQKRSYASLNWVVPFISNGEIVYSEVMLKVCPSCHNWNQPRRRTTPEFADWK